MRCHDMEDSRSRGGCWLRSSFRRQWRRPVGCIQQGRTQHIILKPRSVAHVSLNVNKTACLTSGIPRRGHCPSSGQPFRGRPGIKHKRGKILSKGVKVADARRRGPDANRKVIHQKSQSTLLPESRRRRRTAGRVGDPAQPNTSAGAQARTEQKGRRDRRRGRILAESALRRSASTLAAKSPKVALARGSKAPARKASSCLAMAPKPVGWKRGGKLP